MAKGVLGDQAASGPEVVAGAGGVEKVYVDGPLVDEIDPEMGAEVCVGVLEDRATDVVGRVDPAFKSESIASPDVE